MTIRSYLKKENSLDLDPCIECLKINSKYYKRYLDKILSKGFIKVSSLPMAVLIIFIKKHSSSLYFYIDY